MTDLEQSEAYEHFSAAVDGPLTVISIAWLPILIIPLAVQLHGSVASSFDVIDYVVWAMFVVFVHREVRGRSGREPSI